MTKAKTISTEQLQQRLEQGNSLHFWNVLTDGYFKGEMIPAHAGCRSTLSDASYPTLRRRRAKKSSSIAAVQSARRVYKRLKNLQTSAIPTLGPTRAALKSGRTPATRSNVLNKPARLNGARRTAMMTQS